MFMTTFSSSRWPKSVVLAISVLVGVGLSKAFLTGYALLAQLEAGVPMAFLLSVGGNLVEFAFAVSLCAVGIALASRKEWARRMAVRLAPLFALFELGRCLQSGSQPEWAASDLLARLAVVFIVGAVTVLADTDASKGFTKAT